MYDYNSGEIICFNNHRVLHGRTAFKVTKTTSRHLQICYLEWNQVDLRMRVLQEQENNC